MERYIWYERANGGFGPLSFEVIEVNERVGKSLSLVERRSDTYRRSRLEDSSSCEGLHGFRAVASQIRIRSRPECSLIGPFFLKPAIPFGDHLPTGSRSHPVSDDSQSCKDQYSDDDQNEDHMGLIVL